MRLFLPRKESILGGQYGKLKAIARIPNWLRTSAPERLRAAGSIPGHSEFISWLRAIFTNQCLMALRARRRKQFVFLDGDWMQEGGRSVRPSREITNPSRNPKDFLRSRENVATFNDSPNRKALILRSRAVSTCEKHRGP
jgi:hypothetical protein